MLLQKGVNFLLIPILTLYLTTFDYGVIAVILAINAFLNTFYLLGLNSSLNRFYYEYKNDTALLKKLFGTIITFVVFNSILITFILILARKWFIIPFLVNVDFFPFMILGLISVLFNPCFTIYQNTLQASQNGTKYGKNNLMFFIVNITLLLISVVIFDMGAIGVLGSLAITNIIFFIYTLFQFKSDITFGIELNILKKTLKYSAPLIPHTLSGYVSNMIDRIFINKYLSTSLVGIYSVGSNFGNIIFLVASGINQAFVPWFNSQVKSNELDKIPKVANILTVVYSIIALGLSFFGKEIIVFITPKTYHESWIVIPLIAYAFVFHGIYYFFAGVLFYNIDGKGNRIIPFVTVSTAVINISLNIFAIPKFGILGAAAATFVSKIILAVSLSFIYRKFINIKYSKFFLFITPTSLFIISQIAYLPFENDLQFFILKCCVFLLAVIACCIFVRKDLKSIFKKKH